VEFIGIIDPPGDEGMSESRNKNPVGPEQLDRRAWIARAAAGAACFGGIGASSQPGEGAQQPILSPAQESARELERARARVSVATSQPLHTVLSQQYQAIGDATEPFLKTILADCDLIASDYLEHYQAKGFAVKRPERRLTLVVFLDERPYLEFARKFATKVRPDASGFYSRSENWLVLFDFRNVPKYERGAARTNARTLAHEATHQLTFNTGLLNRRGDVPLAVLEGLALYSEVRPLHGRKPPGQVNRPLLDDLAHIQRRLKWRSAIELLCDDEASFGTTVDQTLLAYAQSWLLVYSLMKSPTRLRQFQAYLKTIYTRTDTHHRFEDAKQNFGDLNQLDQELRREARRLQQSPQSRSPV
jgi:hypothetical protein